MRTLAELSGMASGIAVLAGWCKWWIWEKRRERGMP